MAVLTRSINLLRSLLKDNPALPWVIAFLVLNVAVTQYGGTNAKSRIAALRAITESRTLSIDRYKNWTYDWSLSPNGHYYSNKAPGAIFLGLPIFVITDGLAALTAPSRDDDRLRDEPGYAQHLILVLLTQLLPIALLVLWFSKKLPPAAAHFFALATLFGNTAAFLFNSYFGHGLAATLFLSCLFSLRERRFAWAGLFFGFTLLTDYIAATLLPSVLLLLWFMRKNLKKDFFQFGVGGVFPGLLWIWYHTVCFGSPFSVASAYINPAVGGGSHTFPQWEYLQALLFGTERGILFTQPWVYAGLLGLLFIRSKVSLFAWLALIGPLWLTASTNSWHGGASPGPRYLAVVFPCLAAVFASEWTKFSPLFRMLLWIGLSIAVTLRMVMYPFTMLSQLTNLWQTHIHGILHPYSSTVPARLLIFLAVMAVATFFVWKKHGRVRQNHA